MRIPHGAMIPTTVMRFKNVTWNALGTKNRPAVNATNANSNAMATTIACTEGDTMLAGIIHLANAKKTLTGKDTASKSLIVMLAGESESGSSARKKGSKIAQPITPDTAKYGSANISNILDQGRVPPPERVRRSIPSHHGSL